MSWHVLGIRHHGPGCARSLLAALEAIQPDVIVMEGPSDGEEILSQAAHPEMKPPVAMLFYPPDAPKSGVYYPLAVFSPEWQALQWALKNKITIKLMDLPQAIQLAQKSDDDETEEETDEEQPVAEEASDSKEEPVEPPLWRTDPIAVLAEAAGFADHELWWEEQVERRQDASGLFQAILEAMSAVRQEYPDTNPRDVLREAHMRQVLRATRKSLFPKVAIICGAYHAPVLTEEALDQFTVKDDAALLKGLSKTKTLATWIPWSHSRLSFRSGYGAGVHSPGWYQQVWEQPVAAPLHFITQAARLLRESDLDASSASVIESLRLADTLAAMRDLRSPGLSEINEAILTVLCHGSTSPLRLIHNKLEVGDIIGEVPEEVASVPIARDLEQLQKSLRLKRTTEIKTLDLDLRKENDLARSVLFHRLTILGIEWATKQDQNMGSGTFHEYWQLAWKPELAVEVIEANLWGATVELAACNKVIDMAKKASAVAMLAEMLNQALLAELKPAIPTLLQCVQSQAAVSADIQQLMLALPALTKTVRYSDVRQTEAAQVLPIIEGIAARIFVGISPACSSLDDDAAQQMVTSIGMVQQSLELLQRGDLLDTWLEKLQRLMNQTVHGLIRGWCCRILLEKGKLGDEEFHRQARLALSPARDPMEVAAWATGLLKGSGMVLLHQDELWQTLDRWLVELPDDIFTTLLPLMRRAFADFTDPERQAMGEKVKQLGKTVAKVTPTSTDAPTVNVERAKLVLPILRQILGLSES